ncbi:MAG TPA: ANTAR domain-containing protein [Propionicimonas sp.]
MTPAGRAPETIASSDDLPVRVDWLQRELAQGPAVNPYLGEVLVSKDLAADQRWPDFGRLCVASLDLRSMVSIRVPIVESDSARLTFYAADPTALDHLDIDAALGLARGAAPATGRLLGEFRQALIDAAPSDFSRIAIAVGIVIARYRLGSSQAFDMLLHTARGLDRALLDVALEVVQRGRLPDGPTVGTHHPRRHRSPESHDGNRGQIPHGRARHVGGPNMWRQPHAGRDGA